MPSGKHNFKSSTGFCKARSHMDELRNCIEKATRTVTNGTSTGSSTQETELGVKWPAKLGSFYSGEVPKLASNDHFAIWSTEPHIHAWQPKWHPLNQHTQGKILWLSCDIVSFRKNPKIKTLFNARNNQGPRRFLPWLQGIWHLSGACNIPLPPILANSWPRIWLRPSRRGMALGLCIFGPPSWLARSLNLSFRPTLYQSAQLIDEIPSAMRLSSQNNSLELSNKRGILSQTIFLKVDFALRGQRSRAFPFPSRIWSGGGGRGFAQATTLRSLVFLSLDLPLRTGTTAPIGQRRRRRNIPVGSLLSNWRTPSVLRALIVIVEVI